MSEHKYNGRSTRRPNNNRNGRRPYNKQGGHFVKKGPQRKPKAKLTLWQKLLKFFGILKSPGTAKPKPGPKEPKTNTRIAKSTNKENFVKRSPKMPKETPRLYIGNLSYEANESDIEDLFKGIGNVRGVEIIYNPRTHKSKGYGFVEMQNLEDATRAVEVLHDQPFMGRNLTVSAANERTDSQDLYPNKTESESSTMENSYDAHDTNDEPVKETVVPLLANSNK